jgi:hypothetical protein
MLLCCCLLQLVKAAAKAGSQEQQQHLPVSIRAQLALLSRQWPVAEAMLLAQGQADDAIALYQQAHRWDDAIRVADTSRHPQTDDLKQKHYQWLLQTGQEDQAGMAKEKEGDLLGAINLYMRGGLPARAAQVGLGCNRLVCKCSARPQRTLMDRGGLLIHGTCLSRALLPK